MVGIETLNALASADKETLSRSKLLIALTSFSSSLLRPFLIPLWHPCVFVSSVFSCGYPYFRFSTLLFLLFPSRCLITIPVGLVPKNTEATTR